MRIRPSFDHRGKRAQEVLSREDITDAFLKNLIQSRDDKRAHLDKNFSMKTIQARVTRNVKEDPSVEECDVWNVETVLLERLPNEEVSLIADPNEIKVEQIPGSKLDSTRTILTVRTQGHSPLSAGDTIQVEVREIPPGKRD
jgi:hypothetical protein